MARLFGLPLFMGALLLTPVAGTAMAEDDTVVRLPGSGEVKSEKTRSKLQADRLKPGGGLLASFDTDEDGRISGTELRAGIELAFFEADQNGDGVLTALEQQAWARDLPTRDDSLANPVRFDPNLDRRVSFAEFSAVISNLAGDYTEEEHSELHLASLKAPKDEKRKKGPDTPDGEAGQPVRSTDF